MKTNLLLTVITLLSLGALVFVRAQDDDVQPTSEVEPTEAETTQVSEIEETAAPPSGIRTDVAVEQKLLGGSEAVTVIPVASVFAEGDRFFVLAKTAEFEFGFQEAEVTLGRTDGLNVEITEGILPGDEVVTVSVNQLRFPAFGDGKDAFCGTSNCGPKFCDSVTGVCSVKGENPETTATCKPGEKCAEGKVCAEGEACEVGTFCADGSCGPGGDLTISADQFFNGTMEVFSGPPPVSGPRPFAGRAPMFFPY